MSINQNPRDAARNLLDRVPVILAGRSLIIAAQISLESD